MVLKKTKVSRLLQQWCRLYCVQDGSEKEKKYHDCYNCDVGYIVFKMVLKKQKVPRLLQQWCLLYCVQDGPKKEKKYHDCYNCDVCYIVFKMVLKKKIVSRLLQLWYRFHCVQDGPEKGKRYHDCYNGHVCYIVLKMALKKEKGTTIVTTVMSVILRWRWSWKRKKVPRLLQLWCLLYCVEDGPEKGKRYYDCYNCDVGYIVFKMVLKKEKGTTIVTTVMSVILCSRWS